MNRIKLFVPLIIFFVIAVFLYFGLGKDPSKIPSALVGKPMPEFTLPDLHAPETSVTNQDLSGQAYLLNIWATWCAACLIEHPYLHTLSKKGVNIIGVNYKDDADAAIEWLKKYKDPYSVVVVDAKGRLGFDLGVTGAPETFLINSEGQIVYRHTGVVDKEVWETKFAYLFPDLKEEVTPLGDSAVSKIGTEL